MSKMCKSFDRKKKSSNENNVTNYNLDFLSLFNPLFIGFFGVISILQNVEKS